MILTSGIEDLTSFPGDNLSEMDGSLTLEDFPKFSPSKSRTTHQRAALVLNNVIFFALLVLIPLAAIPYGTVQPQWEAAFECWVFALVALSIIEGLVSGVWHVSGHSLLIPLLAIIVFAFLQTLPLSVKSTAGIEAWRTISADPFETRLFAFRLLALTLTLGLMACYTSSPRRLHALIYVVIGVAVGSACFGLARETSQFPTPFFILPYLERGIGYGQFINRNHFAFLMEMALGLTLGLIAGGGVRRDRMLFFLAAVALMWVTLVLSNSRGGILGMVAQLFFVALLSPAVRSRKELPSQQPGGNGWFPRLGRSFLVRVALAACLVAVVAAGVVWIGDDSLVGRFEVVPGELSEETADMRQGGRRIEIWRATWLMIKAHPIMGVGFGGYGTAISKYHDASGETMPQQAHNDYLELQASGGFIGLALGIWFAINFGNLARQRLRSTDPFRRAACFGALAGIFGVAVHSLLDFGLHITANALVFAALVVIATVNGRAEQNPEPGSLPHQFDGQPALR